MVVGIIPFVLEYEVIWGHIDILVVAVRRLWTRILVMEGVNSTSGPQPYQPYEGGDYHLPYFQQFIQRDYRRKLVQRRPEGVRQVWERKQKHVVRFYVC